MSPRPVFVVAGVGTGTGTGAATARLLAQKGWRVALVARNPDNLINLAKEINEAGGEAAGFPVHDYSYNATLSVFDAISAHKWSSGEPSEVRGALWNAGVQEVWKPFLEVSEKEIETTLQFNVAAAFGFARGAILAFKKNELDERGARGTLLFTGATASIRGNVRTSGIAAVKFAVRALSQSLAKEFGKDNIHVAHAIIDGIISTGSSDVRLDANSIAKNYVYLAEQDRSAWTWELDLRPAHEKW
ncbi:NAD-P-binding protein [Polyporus arcularius HHB13444]|uniref:NAD-P-binding protein n=1 Tax=Polyporus arcularius HHB13444 TaxID=1314778 RepID=A0A5C3PL01_9APHY|nr:NAD-P-binding protein [Polyporus arcularius HHB13444]